MAHPKTKRGGTKRAGQVVPNPDSATTDGMCSPLRAARKAANMNQDELERLTGLSQTTISKIERRGEDYGRIELRTARALAAALGTTVDALFPPKGGA